MLNIFGICSFTVLIASVLSAGVCFAEGPAGSKVGMLLPLSGSYATVGKDTREGVEAALSDSGVKLEVVYADSKADATTAVGEFRKLTSVDKVAAVFAFRGPVGMAVNPLSRSSHVALLGGVGNKDFTTANEYAIQVWPRSDEEGAFLADTLKDQGLGEIALFTAQDDWTNAVSQGIRAQLAKNGGKVVFDHELVPAENDFRTALTQMAAKSPRAVVINVAIAQIGPILKQMRERNVTIPIFANFWVAKKDVVESAGKDLVEGVRFVEMDTDLPRLKSQLKDKYNSTPSGATLSAYVATMLLSQASSAPQASKNPAEFFEQLANQKEIRTPDRVYTVENRCVKLPMVVKVMRDGHSVAFQPNAG